ncbi:Chondramide synthase cmdD [Rubrobacter xylanophilus DSM 9941]|uniref:PEP-utilizing enzyme n=1 Tax=Rubrobacter xylanophilus TaxID=49319 RepID=UPI001C641D0A|nr:PEP-utilizing enzyme [Rubrobacter xylanophilus]QYJ14809.1 Chondramide synthase cmdD [Rubrobacter xylanophilus DSM 9941]
MTAEAEELRAFPSPFSIETPEGCEGWEEMYPPWALFDERRREHDENRLWFWNSMHFPVPMPAFDMVEVDTPYYALGGWQNRAFAVPGAMGVDYRIVNGYVYISPNPVTDPEKIAERSRFFQQRAGYYYENWDELYARWRERMEALNREVSEIPVPGLPEYEPEAVVFEGGEPSWATLLASYRRALDCIERMWQYHFEFLLLGYGAYLTFSEFCKQALPDIPDQHISQMVAGIDVVLFRPDAELRRLARLAIDLGVAEAFREGRSPEEIEAELGRSDAGRRWLEELEKVKDPWFNMGTGDGLYHYYGSWHDDPSIPYSSLIGHIAALQAGEDIERPTRELAERRDRLVGEYEALMDEEARQTFRELLGLSRKVFPYVEEHKFYCDYWFQSRFFNKIREFGALLARHGFIEEGEDIFQLSRYEVMQALEELALTWSTGGEALGPHHWPQIVERRKRILKRLEEWTPPPALGRMPEAVVDPAIAMLWGVTPQQLQEWARAQRDGSGNELAGAAASPGEVEGTARVVRSLEEISEVRAGEILVCTSTSPAWAPIFSKIKATVTDIGGIMSHAAIVSREYGLPAVVGTGTATSRIKTGQRVRVDGTNGRVTVLDG